ncbi:hypothetical protein D7193_11550 [Micromonospora costi]|uniref:Uncharacterized protein n=1 Tax=Micromonospora costi TaxID=1530042 RepID=A0A3B0A4F4_9ACTN|nr:hypothetical protein D7193_11550 [Micromonospora costi]
MQHFQGTSKFGTEAKEILALIEAHAGSRTEELVSSLHELEDDDARAEDRLTAKQRLKNFLYYVGGQAGNLGTSLLQKYLELRLGLGGGS